MTEKKNNLIGAIFLIAGVCIGGGMLALPVDTAATGFIPSSIAMIVCWLFMTLTALLYVEANLWMEEGTHVMTMAYRLLGRFGKYVSLILFLFMAYASLIAYVTGGGRLIEFVFLEFFKININHAESCIIFTLFFGSILFLGTKLLGKINAVLVSGMIFAYLGLLISGVSGLDAKLLIRQNFASVLSALPILLTIFSFQMIVPSLVPYLNRNPKLCFKAIIFGTSIPLIAYLLWQFVVLGSIPLDSEYGLSFAKEMGHPATESIRYAVSNNLLSTFTDFFAFFAIATSFLGISLGLFDFLADSLKFSKIGIRKVILITLVTVPSAVLGILFPKAFILFLEITGGFGDTILNGILPIMMVWSGRYYLEKKGEYSVRGGKRLLVVLFAFSVLVIISQIKNTFHW